MLRINKQPSTIARSVAYVCSHYGVEFFYFTPEDINLDTKKISGLFLVGNRWIRKETGFPNVIDNTPPRKQDVLLYELLERSCYLTTRRIGSKQKIFNRLKKEGGFNDVLIPFETLQSSAELEFFLEKYGAVVLKPSRSNMGKDVYTLKRVGNEYLLSTDTTTKAYNHIEFASVLKQTFLNRLFIVQPYIESKTKEGHPFDIRIHTRKDRNGNWKTVKIYPRIGIGRSITSNISQGGGISNINTFLKSQFGDRWEVVKNNINSISKMFPQQFQKLYKYSIDALGIDFGIDPSGKLWLFEVNTFPGAQFFEIEDAEVRVQYYLYCVEKNEKIIV